MTETISLKKYLVNCLIFLIEEIQSITIRGFLSTGFLLFDYKAHIETELTKLALWHDVVRQFGIRSLSHGILCHDTEGIGVTLDEATHCVLQLRRCGDRLPHLSGTFSLLDDVTRDGRSAVIVGFRPAKSHGALGDVLDRQMAWFTWFVCNIYSLFSFKKSLGMNTLFITKINQICQTGTNTLLTIKLASSIGKKSVFTQGIMALWSYIIARHYSHNEHNGISNYQPHDCLPNCLFRRISKKTSKLRVTDSLCGEFTVIGEFPAQRVSNAENVSDDVIMIIVTGLLLSR